MDFGILAEESEFFASRDCDYGNWLVESAFDITWYRNFRLLPRILTSITTVIRSSLHWIIRNSIIQSKNRKIISPLFQHCANFVKSIWYIILENHKRQKSGSNYSRQSTEQELQNVTICRLNELRNKKSLGLKDFWSLTLSFVSRA